MKKILALTALIVSLNLIGKGILLATCVNPAMGCRTAQPTTTTPPSTATSQPEKDKKTLDQKMDGAKMTAEERRALWNRTVSIKPPDVGSYYERLFAPLDKKEEALPRPDKSASSAKPKEPEKSFAETYPKLYASLKYGVFPFGAAALAIKLGFASLGPLGIAGIGVGGYMASDIVIQTISALTKVGWKKNWKKVVGAVALVAIGGAIGFGLAYYAGFSLMYKALFGLAGAALGFLGIQSLMPTEKQN